MKTSKRPLIMIVTFTALLLCFPLLIYAYIDPGTGSYIIQMVRLIPLRVVLQSVEGCSLDHHKNTKNRHRIRDVSKRCQCL